MRALLRRAVYKYDVSLIIHLVAWLFGKWVSFRNTTVAEIMGQ